MWGVRPGSIDNAPNAEGDPIEEMRDVHFETLAKPAFDLATVEDQRLVLGHLDRLFDPSTGKSINGGLVGAVKDNPIEAFRLHCSPDPDALDPPPPASERPYCADLDAETGLPTGNAFREGLFRFLANGEGVVRPPPPLCLAARHTARAARSAFDGVVPCVAAVSGVLHARQRAPWRRE